MSFPAIVSLADVAAGIGGFKIQGQNAGDHAGNSIAAAGDLNDDGVDDLIVAARSHDTGGTDSGAAYVLYGSDAGFASLVDLDSLAAGDGGFRIQGEAGGDNAAFAVSGHGDVNGDGIDDVLIGALLNDSGGGAAGAAYVVYGDDSAFGSLVNLDDIAAGTGGFKIQGESAGDQAGPAAMAGDVNGDGFADVLIGAYNNDSGGANAGAAYVVFGQSGGPAGLINLDAVAAGTGGFKIQGETAGDVAGNNVAAAGDVNGDGLDDVIIGARGNDSGGSAAGAAYVVFGTASSTTPTIDLDAVALGTGGFKIQGEAANHLAGFSVAAAGDVDGDGYDDVIVGATRAGGGAAYVVYGSAAAPSAPVDLDAVAAGTGGFKIVAETTADSVGWSVAAAGDVNGDGQGDLIVGGDKAPDGDGADTGAAYVIFGREGGFAGAVDLADIALGEGGFKIEGEATGDRVGFAVTAAGDVNGDGFDDLAVGSYTNGSGGTEAGAAYVIFGQQDDLPPVFTASGPFTVAENSAAGTVVGDVDADDGEGGAADENIVYSITAGNTDGAFAIDADGTITVADPTALDFETTAGFALTVNASDGALQTDQQITIELTDVNDGAPVFTAAGPFSIAENSAAGTVVGDVDADDGEGGAADENIVYSITAGNTAGAFAIGPDGTITVADAAALDFETASSLNLTIRADDGALQTDEVVTVAVTDVDEAPVFSSGTFFSVDLRSPNGTLVGDVDATDGDGGATDDGLTYAIVAGDPDGTFAIDATGRITVADRSGLSGATLTVRADDGTLSTDQTVFVLTSFTAYIPSFTALGPFSVAENSPDGTVVGDVDAVAGGPADQDITYSLTGSDAFAIDAATGVITVAAGAALDHEATPAIMVVIEAESFGAGTAVALPITVTDVPENGSPTPQTDTGIAVYEDATTANLWDRLLANDTDPDGDALTIVSVDTTGTVGSVQFDAARQVLTYSADANSLDALKPTDAPAPVTFSYTVSDGSLTATSTVTLDVQGVIEPVLPGLFVGTAAGDVLQGTARAEAMGGRGGNDLIIGAGGVDAMDGGGGRDTFVFASGSGRDIITDFKRGQDAIDARALFGEGTTHQQAFDALDGDHNGTINAADPNASVFLGAITLAFDAQNSVSLVGVRALSAGDFDNLFA